MYKTIGKPSLATGLDILFQVILSFSFKLLGENILYIVFIPRLERETWFAFFFFFNSEVVS